MLILNMVSTLVLTLISFAVIYTITYNSVNQRVEQSLYREINFHNRFIPENEPKHDEMPRINPDTLQDTENRHKLNNIRNFSVEISETGSIKTNSMFGEDSELYSTVAKEAAKQRKMSGRFRCENIYWQYISKEYEDGSRIIALADVTAEREVLARLILSFLLSSAVLLICIFLLSLYFANRSIKPVKEMWDKQKQFIADASHELKTPLAAINTNVDVVLSHPSDTVGEQAKWLEYIKSEAERLTNLTGNLLFIARVDGTAQIPMQTVLVSDIFESSSMNMEAVAFEKGKNYFYETEPGIYANANADQITRLSLILIDNAIKYSDKNIEIGLKRIQKDSAVFFVKNDGEVIPKDEQTKIFDRFYRVDKSRTGNSYGLGLSMAKEIAQLHGAKLTVESSKEDGTVFSFVFTCVK